MRQKKLLPDSVTLYYQKNFYFNTNPVKLLWFRAKTMPQIKGKQLIWYPPDRNRVKNVFIWVVHTVLHHSFLISSTSTAVCLLQDSHRKSGAYLLFLLVHALTLNEFIWTASIYKLPPKIFQPMNLLIKYEIKAKEIIFTLS